MQRMSENVRDARGQGEAQASLLREEMAKLREGETIRMGEYAATHLKAVSGCVKLGLQALICAFTHVSILLCILLGYLTCDRLTFSNATWLMRTVFSEHALDRC